MPAFAVEVVYAAPGRHEAVSVVLEEGATAQDAVRAAGLRAAYAALAIFGEVVEPGRRLREGDRVELLRPLAADPKEARRARAQRKKRPAAAGR